MKMKDSLLKLLGVGEKSSSRKPKLTTKPKVKDITETIQPKLNNKYKIDSATKNAALEILRIYLQVRKAFSGKAIPVRILEEHKTFMHFIYLVEHFQTFRVQTGLVVDKVAYIQAHFAIFGKNTYPSQLRGDNSWKIYNTYKMHTAIIENPKQQNTMDQQTDLLRYLAETRGDSMINTMKLLHSSGIFTDEFVMEWRGGKLKQA